MHLRYLMIPLLVVLAQTAPPPGPRIALRREAQVASSDVRLADIAEITAASEAADAIGAVVIGPAPLPGLSRSIRLGYVKVRLRQNGFDPDDMAFGDVREVIVRRADLMPPVQSLHPTGGNAHKDETAIRAARRIPRGHIITPEDLHAPSPSQVQQFLGLRARHFIENGSSVTSAMLEPVPTVERGDLVTLTFEMGAVRVKAWAEVRSPATVGALTKVRILQTNKLLDAKVLDSHNVLLPCPDSAGDSPVR